MQRDPELRRIIEACELVSADGQAVVWASRLLGDPLPERVAGIDLMQELFALAERRGFRVFILGAKAEVLERARAKIIARHPRLQLVGTRDGYFTEEEGAAVAEEVRDARPDILFVAISSPRKEYWLGRYGRAIDVPFVMGVGGAIDVVAGITQRAPRPLQRLGLEWAYRLAQEPRRLWRRYALTNIRFAWLLAVALARRRAALAAASSRSTADTKDGDARAPPRPPPSRARTEPFHPHLRHPQKPGKKSRGDAHAVPPCKPLTFDSQQPACEGSGRVTNECATCENFVRPGKTRSDQESGSHLHHIHAGSPKTRFPCKRAVQGSAHLATVEPSSDCRTLG